MAFSKLSKSQLVSLLEEIDIDLRDVIVEAEAAAKNYCTSRQDQLAFEVGYLRGRIKGVNYILGSNKTLSK